MKTIQLKAILVFTFVWTYGNASDALVTLNNNDLQVINAAIEHPDGSAYFFVGKYWHQYDTRAGKLKRMGLIGKDAWYGLPKNVDAALLHPHNEKGYFFRGNQYHRYDFNKKKVDNTGILNVDDWKGLEGPIDAAIMHPTNNCAYFFKGKKYYRYSFSKKKVDKAGTIGIDAWKGFPGSIDATIMHSNGRAYAFKNDHYYRYVYGKKVDKKGVVGRDGWNIFHQLDAVVFNDSDKNLSTDNTHYIRGAKGYYTSIEFNNIGAIYFKDTHKVTSKKFGREWYRGVPPNIDAGFKHEKNGKYYFFKGDTYYRYDPKSKKVDKTAKMKSTFGISNVDAAISALNGYYFFKGDKCYFSTVSNPKVGEGKSISSRFNGVPNELDAAEYVGSGWFYFYKKNVLYQYYRVGQKVKYRTTLPSGLFN